MLHEFLESWRRLKLYYEINIYEDNATQDRTTDTEISLLALDRYLFWVDALPRCSYFARKHVQDNLAEELLEYRDVLEDTFRNFFDIVSDKDEFSVTRNPYYPDSKMQIVVPGSVQKHQRIMIEWHIRSICHDIVSQAILQQRHQTPKRPDFKHYEALVSHWQRLNSYYYQNVMVENFEHNNTTDLDISLFVAWIYVDDVFPVSRYGTLQDHPTMRIHSKTTNYKELIDYYMQRILRVAAFNDRFRFLK